MKAIIIEEAEFNRAFDEFAKDMELAQKSRTEKVREAFQGRDDHVASNALVFHADELSRMWTFHFRTLQERLRNSR